MNKVKAIALSILFFKHYPTVNTFHVTGDEQFFESKNDAEAHAKSLDGKNPVVFEVTRSEAEEAAKETKTAKTGKATDKDNAGKSDEVIALENATQKVAELTEKLKTALPQHKAGAEKKLLAAQEELKTAQAAVDALA